MRAMNVKNLKRSAKALQVRDRLSDNFHNRRSNTWNWVSANCVCVGTGSYMDETEYGLYIFRVQYQWKMVRDK